VSRDSLKAGLEPLPGSPLQLVSRETLEQLERLTEELFRWQGVKNLVGPSTLTEVWTRHVADSVQLHEIAPLEGEWVDLGSGGGFPGLVVAILRSEAGLGRTHMIEANDRKCAFLRQIVRQNRLEAEVHAGRIETVLPNLRQPAVISARAVAPLVKLLDWSNVMLTQGAVGIFPKGQDVETELAEAARSWAFRAELLPSRTDPKGRIVRVTMDVEDKASR
jgi:16S rRNA (guanine527-N7)-methyltransferase